MNKTIDESNTEADSEKEETDENTFAAYVRLHKKCPKCEKTNAIEGKVRRGISL